MTTKQMRAELLKKTENMEEISIADVASVNPYDRLSTMKHKTIQFLADLSEMLSGQDVSKYPNLEAFDALAIDWVYSDTLHWDASLPHRKSLHIIASLQNRPGIPS